MTHPLQGKSFGLELKINEAEAPLAFGKQTVRRATSSLRPDQKKAQTAFLIVLDSPLRDDKNMAKMPYLGEG